MARVESDRPVSFNEIQAERVIKLWHEYIQEPYSQMVFDEFVNWLEKRDLKSYKLTGEY